MSARENEIGIKCMCPSLPCAGVLVFKRYTLVVGDMSFAREEMVLHLTTTDLNGTNLDNSNRDSQKY